METKPENTMLDRLKKDIGANFKTGDEEVLNGFIEDYYSIASNNSNRKKTDAKLYPYVYNAVKSAYLRRGDEGSSSATEGSQSSSYVDIEEKLAKDVRTIRIMR